MKEDTITTKAPGTRKIKVTTPAIEAAKTRSQSQSEKTFQAVTSQLPGLITELIAVEKKNSDNNGKTIHLAEERFSVQQAALLEQTRAAASYAKSSIAISLATLIVIGIIGISLLFNVRSQTSITSTQIERIITEINKSGTRAYVTPLPVSPKTKDDQAYIDLLAELKATNNNLTRLIKALEEQKSK